LLVNHSLCTSTELWPNGIKVALNAGYFLHGYGCTGIAFLATKAMAFAYVATEMFRHNVYVYYHIAHHEHWGQFVLLYHCMGVLPVLMR
jgi:hypothetical protein